MPLLSPSHLHQDKIIRLPRWLKKSYINLRNHATGGNRCSLPAAVKQMFADRWWAKVWSLTIVLWYTLINIDISNSCLKFTGPYFSYIFYTGMLRLGNFYLVLYFFWFALYWTLANYIFSWFVFDCSFGVRNMPYSMQNKCVQSPIAYHGCCWISAMRAVK